MPVDERTFVAQVASWINEILGRTPTLPYGEARVEESRTGSKKRSDLRIYRRGSNAVALTGEVKMPDQPYGKNHLDMDLINDAWQKAGKVGANYYFTWNVNRFALFETHQENVPFTERTLEDREVVRIEKSDDVRKESVQEQIKAFWGEILDTLRRIETGERQLLNLRLDRRFVVRLQEALEEPAELAFQTAHARYGRDEEFRAAFRSWMRDEQGWEVADEPEALKRNIERAAKLSCYVLANRLVFYEVLRRRFPPLVALRSVSLGTTGKQLAAALNRQFLNAIRESRDYETIFGKEDFASNLPFLTDKAVPSWRKLIDGIEDFDFTRLDYDVIGRMYEQLISPEERWRWGQFFTKPEVVDLISAFCIRSADAKVLDPACGGGTFLVRAYARKRVLAERAERPLTHQELLSSLNGVDIAAFPAQLSTINLAARHLAAEANYPRVIREDFFNVRVGAEVARLPIGAGDEDQLVTISDLDAVVGNPPYIRQEEIAKDRKDRLVNLLGTEYGAASPRLSGRSDLYAYFFPHGAAFLKDGGYLGLVTSVGWLDTEYGFRLQDFFLTNFRIVAVLESQVEKWFEDARVTTAVTILQKEPNEAIRNSNMVRFIQLRDPLAQIYGIVLKGPLSETDESKRQEDMEAIRDLLEQTAMDDLTDYWRIRVVNQRELWERGCRLRLGQEAAREAEAGASRYKGGKWGQYIRAPDVYFDLLDRCRDQLVPLSELADIAFGFKTGVDKFFCVRDITEDEMRLTRTPGAFRRKWSISPEDTKKVRIVQSGDKSAHLVEAKYLEPEFHRLTEATRVVVTKKDVSKKVINAPVSRAALRKTHLAKYVEYAERQNPPWHTGATVASRAKTRPWYDLGLRPKGQRGVLFWPKAQQYRHLAPWNNDQLPCNANLYDVWPLKQPAGRLLWAVLNSTVVALVKHRFGRLAGVEGNLKTEVVDVEMMLVPDPRGASVQLAKRVVAAAEQLSKRTMRRFLYEEFELEDRKELDDVVLELLGIAEPEERHRLRSRIYAAVEQEQRETRERELLAQKDRTRATRTGGATPAEQAAEIWEAEQESLGLQEFPRDFIRARGRSSNFNLPSGRVEVGHAMMETGKHLVAGTVRVGGVSGDVLDVGSVAKAEFLEAAAECGHHGAIDLPRDDDTCAEAVTVFRQYKRDLEERFIQLAEQRTRDAKRQKALVRALLQTALSWSNPD